MKIVKVPRINALEKKGPEQAPDLILEELKKDYSLFDVLDLEKIEIDNSNIDEAEKLIYENAVKNFETNEKIIFLGGDHSISFPILNAFNEKFENSFLIVFDAHADCMPCMKEPTHEEWLREIVEKGFSPENIVLIGVRKIEDKEKLFLDDKQIKYFSSEWDLEGAADYITERANGKNVYVSIDVDLFNPCEAPAVNYPEPVGFSSKEFFYLFRRILHIKTLKGFDIVELVPEKDEKYDLRTTKLIVKILKLILGSDKFGNIKLKEI